MQVRGPPSRKHWGSFQAGEPRRSKANAEEALGQVEGVSGACCGWIWLGHLIGKP